METNYNTDDFEHFLRETTDEFRMYPSRRVWHSLYNDLHPSRKWPSVAVLLMLITSLLYVGVTHTDQPGSIAKDNVQANTSASLANNANTSLPADRNSTSANRIEGTTSVSETSSALAENKSADNIIQRDNNVQAVSGTGNLSVAYISKTNVTDNPTVGKTKKENPRSYVTKTSTNEVTNDHLITPSLNEPETRLVAGEQKTNNTVDNKVIIADVNNADVALTTITSGISEGSQNKTVTNSQSNQAKPVVMNVKIPGKDDLAWMEDYVLHNKKQGSKFKSKLTYQVYVTPSVGYRSLKKNTEYSPPPANSLLTNPYQIGNMEYILNHNAAVNLEAGANAFYSFNKKIRFKTGFQFNYTNYQINAFQLNHPTFTTLMLNDLASGYPILKSSTSSVANASGPTSKNLNNNTYQLSVPIGADYKIAGNNSFKWYAGATIQPTYVTGGHSYLISSDMKNYVDGESFMRKFNVNSAVETFVSYKTKNGVILSAGPQFRYQLLSTYNKKYTYDEKLYNVGVKLAMSARF